MNDHRRKRSSKWDIGTEACGNLVSDIGQQNPLLSKANSLLNHEESGLDQNIVEHNVNQISNHPDLEHEDGSKLGQLPKRNGVDECFKMAKSTKQFNMEVSYGDDHRKSYQEGIAENQTSGKENISTERELDGLESPLDEAQRRSISPSVDKWRRQSRSISPIRGRNRSHCRSNSSGRSRSWSRSRSRSHSWSRSPPYVSKRGSERWLGRGRSCSPPHGSRHGSERWAGRDRIVLKGSAEPCRDFAVGRCRRGSQCRYLHDDGCRLYDNCSGRGTLEIGDSKSGRRRYESCYNKDNATGPVEERDYSRDKGRWHGNHQTVDQIKAELNRNNRNNRLTERCNNFTKGRCNKGSVCRYIHHTTAAEVRVYTEDESRDRLHGGRDADASFRPRLERPRLSDTPCKFFAEGRCHRGEDCRFSHQGMVNVDSEEQPYDNALSQDTISLDVPNWSSKTAAICLTNPTQGMDDDGGGKEGVTVEAIKSKELLRDDGLHSEKTYDADNKYEYLSKEISKIPIAPQGQNATLVASEQHQQVSAAPTQSMSVDSSGQLSDRNCEMPTVNAASITTPSPRNILGQTGPNHNVVSQPLIGQTFPPNPQLQQISSMLASGGQMQQISTPLSLNQFADLQVPSASQNFNSCIQSQGFLPSPLNGQVLQRPMFGMQNQQNLQLLQNHQIQQNLKLSGQIQQGLPIPFTGHNQQNMNLSQQIQQGTPLRPHLGHSQVNVNPTVLTQPSIPPTNSGLHQQNLDGSKNSQQSLPSHQNGQFQLTLSSLGLSKQNEPYRQNPQDLESNEQNNQAHTNIEAVMLKADSSMKPSPLVSDAKATTNVVTSEQAAQISNLSASLAQFFGSGQNLPQLYVTRNPLTAVGPASGQPSLGSNNAKPLAPAATTAIQPGQGSLVHQYPNPVPDEPAKLGESKQPPGYPPNSFENKDPRLKDSQMAVKNNRIPVSLTGTIHGGDLQQGLPAAEPAEVIGDNEVKEVNQTESGQSKKEQVAQSGDVDPETRTDGESKKSKEAKAMRMFKCALVEFVKDILKPHWKDGVISKEAHKTIVKKVVEKVTGVMQGANLPQTPEKIELYMSHSKAKLVKLVQAYLEKYA